MACLDQMRLETSERGVFLEMWTVWPAGKFFGGKEAKKSMTKRARKNVPPNFSQKNLIQEDSLELDPSSKELFQEKVCRKQNRGNDTWLPIPPYS